MSNSTQDQSPEEPFAVEAQVEQIRSEVLAIFPLVSELENDQAESLHSKLVDLIILIEASMHTPAEADFCEELIRFSQGAIATLQAATGNDQSAISQIPELSTAIQERWGDYLELISKADRERLTNEASWDERSPESWDHNQGLPEADDDFDSSYTAESISQLMSNLESIASIPESSADGNQVEPSSTIEHLQEEAARTSQAATRDFSELLQETIDDPDLISAYVDDAQQCLSGMEMCLLELDNNPNSVEHLRQFCRELHTLKGASGTVGLMTLAEYLHELENNVDQMSRGGKNVEIDPLLEGVDFVRQQLGKLLPDAPSPEPAPVDIPQPSNESGTTAERTTETYVRLEASRLDRLMDLLAELVMLRNRRETFVSSLQELHHEINSCAGRLRLIDTHVYPNQSDSVPLTTGDHSERIADRLKGHELTSTVTEISKDIRELGRSLHDVVDPLQRDNSTISHLIGSFRSELMELRRQPVAGLFRRLFRVARDASKTEGRQVELNFLGQGTRAERSFQERLYEPLMHIIRNAISHGIESAEDRLAAGKPLIGQITMEAWSDATSLYLEIRDDGRGLNEQILEQRGRELGLIPPGARPSKEKLWELILQPGFSTRKEVSQISGRGVGMDVVASQIRSMRGRIKIDSVIGEFTSFQLEIPLNSTIEHAMIVRCGNQLFALPMHSIYGTQTDGHSVDQSNVIGLHQILGISAAHSPSQRVITLRHQDGSSRQMNRNIRSKNNLSIYVDAVVGVEEVVVRSLPNLLRNHECFSGVTLSGEAETVLVLDVPRLSDYATQLRAAGEKIEHYQPVTSQSSQPDRETHRPQGSNSHAPQLLVVDDSVSVRRSLVRKLQGHGFSIVEAADGIQAVEKLRSGKFAAVISDIDMPRMNGIEFITELRRIEAVQNMPVFVVSSRRDDASLKAIQSLGVRKIFKKPVTDSMVKTLVQSIRNPSSTIVQSIN